MSRLVHATVGSVELPGTSWLRELTEVPVNVDAVSPLLQSPVDVDTTRGPAGRWPDHTPPYDTPATVQIAHVGQLNAAIGNASGGDVIEVAGTYDASGSLTITNSPGGEGNVLVRPPLGQRGMNLRTGGDFRFGARPTSGSNPSGPERITLAGFNHPLFAIEFNHATDCVLAWFTSAPPPARIDWRGSTRCGLYEFVRRDRDGGASDASQLLNFRNSGWRVCEDTFLIGCWLNGGESIKDNLQTLQAGSGAGGSGSVLDGMLWAHSVFLTGRDKVHEANASISRWVIDNIWTHSGITAAQQNGGDYDWSLSSGSPTISEACINARPTGTQNTISNSTILGRVGNELDEPPESFVITDTLMRAESSVPYTYGAGVVINPNAWESPAPGHAPGSVYLPPPPCPTEQQLDEIWSP